MQLRSRTIGAKPVTLKRKTRKKVTVKKRTKKQKRKVITKRQYKGVTPMTGPRGGCYTKRGNRKIYIPRTRTVKRRGGRGKPRKRKLSPIY